MTKHEQRLRREKLRRMEYRESLRELGDSPAALMVLREFFKSGFCLEPIEDTNAGVYRKIGVRDFCLELWRDLHAANPDASMALFDQLMTPIQLITPIQEENDDGTE